MKKFLSLVMALIMVMSLVTVASAADYTDAADVSKAEAVDVMSAVGVFQGSAGKFNPKAILNRAEAAKLIAYLDLGEDTAEALPAVQAFSDVPATHWAAKYIAYCADAGYINGVGNGKFDPAGKLTGYQFGKLVLCVLGYDATIEAFVGANWSIAVAKLMQSNDINKGVKAAPSAELTREDAAQYCLNALKATTVEYASKGTNVTINGVVIATGASKAEVVLGGTTAKYGKIDSTKVDGKFTVELGEKLFDGKLVLQDLTDDFNRDAAVWTYKNDEVGKYADTADFTFTVETSSEDVAKALKGIKDLNGYKVEDDTKLTAYTNETSAENIAGKTANGKLVEIFVDSTDKISKIVEVPYTVGKVTNIVKNNKGDITYTITNGGSGVDYADPDTADTISIKGTIAKDDIVTFTKPGSVSYVYPTTKLTGVVTAAKSTDFATIGGTKYPQSTTVTAKKDEQNVWVDQYGVIVYGEDVSGVSDVVYVTATFSEKDRYGKTTYYAQIVTADGEVKEIKKTSAAVEANGVYTYTLNSDDLAVFTNVGKSIKAYSLDADTEIKTTTAKVPGPNGPSNAYYFADDVNFVFVNKEGAKLAVTTADGVQAVKKVPANSYALLDDGKVVTVFIRSKAGSTTTTKDLLFVKSTSSAGKALDKDNKSGDMINFYLKGEKDTQIMAKTVSNIGFYTYSIDNTTGRYELTQETEDIYYLTVTNNGGAVYEINKDTYINLPAVNGNLKVDDAVLADNCEFYDLSENGIVDLSSLVAYLEGEASGTTLDVHAVYDAKNEVVTCIYVIPTPTP